MSFQLSGDVAFFHSDAAGARACLAEAYLLRHREPSARVRLFSNRAHDFARDVGAEFEPTHLEAVTASCLDGAGSVFTGTSHPESSQGFELRALELARERGLPTAAFIDHWVNFAMRFRDADGGLILPDRILVLDGHALQLAAAEGLPRDRLEIHPNPYLHYLAHHWRPRVERAAMRAALGVPLGARVILYAPDPISLRDAEGRRGFDELSATRELLAWLEVAPPDVRVVLKLHPLQSPDGLLPVVRGSDRIVVATPDASVPELIHASEVVLGFFSNLLLEAEALGRPVVRYHPGDSAMDPFAHLSFGRLTRTPAQLAEALGTALPEAPKQT